MLVPSELDLAIWALEDLYNESEDLKLRARLRPIIRDLNIYSRECWRAETDALEQEIGGPVV